LELRRAFLRCCWRMRLTTKTMCRLSAPQTPLVNGRRLRAREFNRCSCASCSCCACKHYFCRFDMSSSASRQQCADANAVMWTNAAAAAVRAVSAQTLVSAGTFTNHAGAVASACSARVAEKDIIRWRMLTHFSWAQRPQRIAASIRCGAPAQPAVGGSNLTLLIAGDRRFPVRIAALAQFSTLGKCAVSRAPICTALRSISFLFLFFFEPPERIAQNAALMRHPQTFWTCTCIPKLQECRHRFWQWIWAVLNGPLSKAIFPKWQC
jgi:hypothetical protein